MTSTPLDDAIGPEEDHALRTRMESIPIFQTLGFREVSFRGGAWRAVIPRRPEYDGILETFHGGLLITAADSVAALAVLTRAGPTAQIATTDMAIRFLRPALEHVAVEARVVKLGRTLVPLQVDITDGRGLIALAQVTYIRLGSGHGETILP